MPSLQKLQKTFTKIKNQLLTASNYLQLQSTINLFNQVKLKYFEAGDGKKKKVLAEESPQTELKNQLIETTQELIREKIKYFKKLALKKMDSYKMHKHDNSPQQQQSNEKWPSHKKQAQKKKQSSNKKQKQPSNKNQQSNKKQPSLKGQFSNLQSNLTVVNKKKCKQSLPTFFGAKQLRQLRDLEQKMLQKTLNTSNERPQRSASKSQKKLKQSKSANNFFVTDKESFTFRDEQNADTKGSMKRRSQERMFDQERIQENEEKVKYEMDDDSKTQVRVFGKKGNKYKYENNQQEVEYYKQKSQFLQKMMASLQTNSPTLPTDNRQLFEQYHYKIREKTLQLQQVKGRLQFYQTGTQQLRNRLMNEQRRHEDYVLGLKQHIKRQQKQIFSYQKQKKVMAELIREYQSKLQLVQKDKHKYIEQIEMMLNQKQKEKANQRNKGQDLSKELELMARQQANIRDLQRLLNQEKIDNNILREKNSFLKKELQTASQSLKCLNQQKQTLQQLLQLKLQQIQSYKLQLHQMKRTSTQLQQQITNMREEIKELHKSQQQQQTAKEKMMRKKVEKLKQVKGLLVQGSDV